METASTAPATTTGPPGWIQATIQGSATAMGLGVVPLGGGDVTVFAEATGLDRYRHGSIGEIAISVPVTDGSAGH